MKTTSELELEIERLTKENEVLKMAESNYKLWYQMMDRTVDEIYKKYLKLQHEKLETYNSIKQLLEKTL